MQRLGVMCALLSVVLLGACASTAEQDSRFINLRLTPGPQNQGNIAQVGLVAQGEITGVNLFIGGVPLGTSRPLQLYTYIYPGSCAALGAKPAYALNDDVHATPANPGWYLSKRVPLSLCVLRAGSYALLVRTSPADRNLDIFCGDIR